MKRKKQMPCEYCDGVVREQLVRDDYWVGKQLLIIEDVPAGVCDRCGERYYSAVVMERLERIAARRSKIRRKIHVPVAKFGVVA